MQRYRIVYPRSDRTKLSVALVWDYEEDEYDIASRQSFDDKEEAHAYAFNLSRQHGLSLDSDVRAYLD